MTPGNYLDIIIRKKGMGQQQLAKEAGIAQSSLSRILNDKQLPNFKLLSVLRVKYKVDINKFFK